MTESNGRIVPEESVQRNDRGFILEHRRLDAVKLPAKSVRKHKPAEMKKLRASLQEYGMVTPIVIDADGKIIDGVGRYNAARDLGMQEIPVAVAPTGLTKAQLAALSLGLNRLPQGTTWDEAVLLDVLHEVTSADLPAELTGFDDIEIDRILTPRTTDLDEDVVEETVTERQPVSVAYDIWGIGEHRLYHGDARDPTLYAHAFEKEKAALVVADPPYNIPIDGGISARGAVKHPDFVEGSGELTDDEYEALIGEVMALCTSWSNDGALHYFFIDWRHVGQLDRVGRKVYPRLVHIVVWAKSNWGVGDFYRHQHELVLVFKSGDAPHVNNVARGRSGRSRSDLWQYDGATSFSKTRKQNLADHPTVKPLAMIEDLIQDASNPGDLVFDPFAGSGTTLIAAHRKKRRAVIVEMDGRYVDAALRRFMRVLKIEPIQLKTGKTFSEIAAERAVPSAA